MELQSGLIMLDGLQRGIVEDSRDGGECQWRLAAGLALARSVNEGSGLCG